MRRRKVYKKFLSCVLAASMVMTSGAAYLGNGKTAAAAGVEVTFQDDNHNDWYVIDDKDGVLLDAQGVMYQLNQDGMTATVCGFGYNGSGAPAQSDIVKISDTVPISYIDYQKYKQNGNSTISFGATNRTSSNVTAIAANAFSGSSTLTEVTVPKSVIKIGDEAFTSCPELTKLTWDVEDDQTVQIGSNADDWSNAKILEDSPKCIFSSKNSSVNAYAKSKGYTSPRTDENQASPAPSASAAPSQEPSVSPSTAPSQEPSASPSVSPTTAPEATPTAVPVVTPSAIPVLTPSAAPTATPKVPVIYPPSLVTPSAVPATATPVVATLPPVEQTATPGETEAPTIAPTAAANTPVPPSQKPATTEAPTPAVTEGSSDSTPVPVMPTTAPTQEETVVKNNVTYEVDTNSKSVSVSNMGTVKTSTVTIPATVKVNGVSYPVTTIDKGAFKNNVKITNVKLGKNIESIEAGAFQGCKKLTSVKFPSKLQTIEKNSFNGCSSLKSVKVPKTVKKIGKAAFKNCTSMKTFSIGGNPKTKSGGLSLDGKQVCYGASTVTINIGEKAFENCKKLNKVIINALVKIIGKSAFKDCKSLRSVLIYSEVLKKVKGGALTGVNNCKISVPAKKVGPYKILFKNKGQGKKVVVAKL